MSSLRPFWKYYGGKWRAAPRYPAPTYDTIVEPFAGAAGYSLRYPDRKVILVEKYPVLAGMWRYLISVSKDEIRRIPLVDAVDDLPAWVPQEARWLVGFALTTAAASPRRVLSSGLRKHRSGGRTFAGWSAAMRDRVAQQVGHIRHWAVIEGCYSTLDVAAIGMATWFVDPPYHDAGRHYVHSDVDYSELGAWCRQLPGQAIVCESAGANWLEFRPFATVKSFGAGGRIQNTKEVVWTKYQPTTTTRRC